jgi:Ca2+-transporting ATPase
LSRRAWHTLPIGEVATELSTDTEHGLAAAEAASRLEAYGRNETEQQKQRTLPAIVAAQLTDLMILILIAAALISALLGELGDTVTIVVIVVLNAVVGSTQEYRAQRALAALARLSALQATVVRGGRAEEIDSELLVPGDRVLLEAGEIVPADLRLIRTTELVTDEATLTGESETVDKHTDVLSEQALAVGDRRNMAFKSTSVTKGNAIGLVVATGRDTQIGHIASLLTGRRRHLTPLQQRLARFTRRLAVIVICVCAVVFALGILRGEPAGLMFFVAMSLAVAAVPEALPAVVTVSLAFGARTLNRHRSLARRLTAVEALGSVTYICADKTGTLTENRMAVARIHCCDTECAALTDLEGPLGEALGSAMALSNEVVDATVGDPTELALVYAAESAGLAKAELMVAQPLVETFPFDSDRKLMTTVHELDGAEIAYVKGAPEQVLDRSTRLFTGGGPDQAFDPDALHARADALASEGFRVLAFAVGRAQSSGTGRVRDDYESDLEFLGLVALHDPIREEVPGAIEDCRTAGITVVMITGDHPSTARHIAESIGLMEGDAELLTGQELAELSDEALARVAKRVRVYARVDPDQKIRIVEALQSNGEHVAMTGDGVNDAPALRQATIGVAMGQRGTDVARETADIVLLDDNFATIVVAVREGRRVYDNIRKFVRYTMTSNTGEIGVLLMAPLLALPIPLLPIHILWINLVTDGLPGLAFTFERGEADLMRRAPRSPSESVFAHGLWKHMLWIGALLVVLSLMSAVWVDTADQARWQTMVFTTLVVAQLLQALSLRSETRSIFSIGILSNRYMAITVILSVLAQLAVIYTPFANRVLHTVPLSLTDLSHCLLLALIVVPAIEAQKWMSRRQQRAAKAM